MPQPYPRTLKYPDATPIGGKYIKNSALPTEYPEPIMPGPDAQGATQWSDVLAANNGRVQLATDAWNKIQFNAVGGSGAGYGFEKPQPNAPRIIGWNWGQPIYAGQHSQGNPANPTGFGPGGQYTAYNPARDPYGFKPHGDKVSVVAGAGFPRSRIGKAQK